MQYPLDLTMRPRPQLKHFIPGDNIALLNALNYIHHPDHLQLELLEEHDRFIYLWGSQGIGKTYLLEAWLNYQTQATDQAGYYWDAQKPWLESHLQDAMEASFVAIDHVDDLNEEAQLAVFSLYNHFKYAGQGHLLMAGRQAPMQLTHLREDLRTRIAWGLIWQVHGLDDVAKMAVLETELKARGLPINTEVLHYILMHGRRDLKSLLQLIELLDYALLSEKKNQLTIPFVKPFLSSNS